MLDDEAKETPNTPLQPEARMPNSPVRVQRPISRSQPVGPVKPKKLPKGHSFQGSRTQSVKKAEVPMPSGSPVGQLAPPDPTEGLSVSEPANPLDVIGASPPPTAAIGGRPLPTESIPDMKTLMSPAPQQWQSGNPSMSNMAATNMANKNMLQGRMPSGPRAAIPGGYPPGPSASPGAAPAPAAGPAGPAAILAQPQPGLKQGSAAFEFGKQAWADAMALGAGLGAVRAPAGHRTEGAARGARRGLQTAAGMGLGGIAGGALGGVAGAMSSPAGDNHELTNRVLAGLLLGGGLGAAGGGTAAHMYGNRTDPKPSWETGEMDQNYRNNLVASGAMMGGGLGLGAGNIAGHLASSALGVDPGIAGIVGGLGLGIPSAIGAGYFAHKNIRPANTGKPKPKPEAAEKQSAAFNFGTEISRTMKPKTVTRQEGEYRGNDMKTNLAKHGC